MGMSERVLSSELKRHVGKRVLTKGWLHKIRDIGKIVFLVVRDRRGFFQVVIEDEKEKKKVLDLHPGSVLYIEGDVVETGREQPEVEIKNPEITVVVPIKEAPPIKYYLPELDLNLDTELDYRPLVIRNPKKALIFKVQAAILKYLREAFEKREFVEFRPATLMASPSESGADVFEVNFFDKDTVYLAQSPQFYKQIMLGAFERVYCVTPVFRAEKHDTARHLLEITQIDGEMAFINDYFEAIDTAEEILKEALLKAIDRFGDELKKAGYSILEGIDKKWPRLKVKEILKIIEKETGKPADREELDLDPEDERIIGEYVKREYKTPFVWAINFKANKNPYTRDDPKNKDESLSYDLLFNGLEVLSGTWRINDYDELVKSLSKISDDLSRYELYLQAFKWGMPPEAGFSYGLERLTKQFFGLKNIREATLFVTDLKRVGGERLHKIDTQEEHEK